MKLRTFLISTPDHTMGGEYNGYIVIPREHPLFEKHYDDVPYVCVHGGWTFSDSAWGHDWVIGFDTCHSEDTPEKWGRKQVQAEIDRAAKELEDYFRHDS